MRMNYWQKRFLKDKAKKINAAEKYIARTQEKYYRIAKEEIEEAIGKLYQSFADAENISLAEAKRSLSAADFDKIDFEALAAGQAVRNKEYKESIQTLPADAAALIEKQHMQHEKTLSRYSQKGKLTHLSLTEANIDRALLDLYDKTQISMYQMLSEEYEDGYYRSMYRNQQALGFGKDMAALNSRAIEKAVMTKHHKSNYSKTLYEHCKYFSKDMKQNLVTGLILGESMDRMASRMSKRLSVSAAAARRLVRTETAYIYETAAMDSYKECGISQYEFLAALDGKTSEICRELDGKVFDVKDAVLGKNYPPMHPNCRSTTVCHFADDKVTERIAKDKRGKYYSVPSDMTYKEWLQAQKKPELLLTNNEKRSINRYVGFSAYHLNNQLRTGNIMSADVKQFREYLNQALDKMPCYEGNLIRHLRISDEEKRKQFQELHQVGKMVEYSEFLSTSKTDGYSDTSDVIVYIRDAKKGKDISAFNPKEKEVLYKTGSKFKVINTAEQDGKLYILMEESDDV